MPVILASDKTQLSHFSGNKSAWPVYLTISNIPKETWRKTSSHTSILLGYLPVSKLTCFSKARRSNMGHSLFHHCMGILLKPLIHAGLHGIDIACADGGVRHVHPILAAYVVDAPEQALVACCKENWCLQCICFPEDHGAPLATIFSEDIGSIYHQPEDHMEHICTHGVDNPSAYAEDVSLRPIAKPFWATLPHCNIFHCFTPDILHQLHKGLFKDHLCSWCTYLATTPETDARFQAMVTYPSVHHFKKGISTISQWSGNEYKNMEKVFVSVMANTIPPAAMRTARAILDFIYLAQYPSHTTTTLTQLQEVVDQFHQHKKIFLHPKIRTHFQIPKVHALEHYIATIKSRGTADGFSTELPERLHIDFAKLGYHSSSRRDYTIQMVKWITCQEKIHSFSSYLQSLPHPTKSNEGDSEEDILPLPHAISIPAANSPDIGHTYNIAKRPACPNIPIETIIVEY